MKKRSEEDILLARKVLDDLIGRTSYSEVARWLGTSPACFTDKVRRGTLRVADLSRIATKMDKKIVYENIKN